MFLRKCRHHIINGGGGGGGGGGSFLFKSLVNYSTTTKTVAFQNSDLADFLIKSLGFSKEAAISTSSKVIRLKPMKNEPALAVNYLENLGMSKTQVRTFVSSYPQILFYNVDKHLAPKIKVLEEVGLSGSDIVGIVMGHKSLLVKGLNSFIKPRVEYVKELFGTNDFVVATLKRYAFKRYKLEQVKENVSLLQNVGFTNDDIVKLIAKDPRNALFTTAEKLQDILRRVETDLGIPRESPFFHYGIAVASSFSPSNVDGKFEVFKSFGWSDAHILTMVRIFPLVLCISADRMRRALDYYMKELGYNPVYLASHPVILSLSLERRVKPRVEVMKVLDDMKLNKSKAALYTLLVKPEAKFVEDHVRKYKDLLPNMYAEYMRKVGRQKRGQLCA